MDKLVFVTNQFKTGGVETVFLNIATRLNREIILFPAHMEINNYLADQLPENVKLVENKFKIKRNILGIFQTLKTAKVYRKILHLDNRNCTIINFSDTLTSLLLAQMLNPYNCVTWIHCCPKGLLNSKSHKIYFFLIKRCAKIVFICRSQRSLFFKLNESQRININKSFICTNFISWERIKNLYKEPIALNYDFFLMVARLDMRTKDFKTLIKGYSLLPEEIREKYRLLILGEGSDQNEIEGIIKQQKQEKNISLLGNQENPYKYMREASLFIHASKSEGFSMVIIEALACGCTVVASDCEVGPAEILENNKYGYLYEQGNETQLANKIKIALACPIDKKRAQQRAKEITTLGIKQIEDFFRNVR